VYPNRHHEEEGNTLSIIASNRFKNKEMHEHLEQLLRERLPAHLRIKLYSVQPDHIYDFEQIYYKWREALANRDTKKLIHFSESIHAFFTVSKHYLTDIQ
jgi:DNA-directed RNA polymerase subunit F